MVLHGLVNAADLNGKVGTVRSDLTNGRHTVFVDDAKRTVGIRPENLSYEPRTVESLSVRELKLVLKARNNGVSVEADVIGMDKADLQAKVREAVDSLDDIPELLAKARAPQASSSTSSASGTPTTATPGTAGPAQAAEQLQNTSPEQLRQQAQMMRNMDPNVIRRMNPQLANMTDQQIRAAADQMEMMANNPQMMRAAAEQMRAMSPEQLAAMQNGGMGAGPSPLAGGGGGVPNGQPDLSQMGGDPAQMLANMDKGQLKQMLHTLKDNPEMLRQFSDMTGMSEEQVKQGVEIFAEMDDTKMDAALKVMQKVQQAKDTWTRVDAKTGGHLKKILVGIGLALVGLVVWWLFLRSGGSVATTVGTTIPNLDLKAKSVLDDEDDLASEF